MCWGRSLLRHRGAGKAPVARNARKAMDAVLRGVVAYSSVG